MSNLLVFLPDPSQGEKKHFLVVSEKVQYHLIRKKKRLYKQQQMHPFSSSVSLGTVRYLAGQNCSKFPLPRTRNYCCFPLYPLSTLLLWLPGFFMHLGTPCYSGKKEKISCVTLFFFACNAFFPFEFVSETVAE